MRRRVSTGSSTSVAEAGCRTFIVHARKAWLKGLSPKENRDVPPLDYERVLRLKQRRPDLEIVLNGGIESFAECRSRICRRSTASCSDARPMPILICWPKSTAHCSDRMQTPPSRLDVLDRFVPYVEAQLAKGARLNQMTRHILGLFHGQPRARAFRRHLAENAHLDGAGIEVLQAARRIVAGGEQMAIAAE